MTKYLSDKGAPYFVEKIMELTPRPASHEDVDGLFELYVGDVFEEPPTEPHTLYVYLLNGDTLYFTYKEKNPPSGYTVTESYTMAPDTMFTSSSKIPWISVLKNVSHVISDRIVAPVCIMGYFENAKISDFSELEKWDTSHVTSMSGTFMSSKIDDVSPLASWDVSKVTNMTALFMSCMNVKTFKPLDGWDVSSVKDRTFIFASTTGTRPTWGTSW